MKYRFELMVFGAILMLAASASGAFAQLDRDSAGPVSGKSTALTPSILENNMMAPGSGGFSFEERTVMGNSVSADDFESRSPLGALLRSFIVPGWGHWYVDSDNWRMGQYHLAADVALLAAWLGINRQSYVVEKNMFTHASAYSGVDIREHGREFELAVGEHRSWDAYMDHHERTRNWDRLENFPDSPEYRWHWESDEQRREYRDMRSRRDNLNQQLPAITAIMVVNRVISGIGAYNRGRAYTPDNASVYVVPGPENRGFETRLRFSF